MEDSEPERKRARTDEATATGSRSETEDEDDEDYVPYVPLRQRRQLLLQKLLQRRRKGAAEEEQQDSGSEPRGDEDDIPLGPQSNVSLLDQHQHLKEKAEGGLESSGEAQLGIVLWCLTSASFLSPQGVCQGEAAERRGKDPGECG